MDVDEDLAEKMQRIRVRESELQREKDEVKHFARQELSQLEIRIDEYREKIEELEIKRDQLADFLGIARDDDGSTRLGHGALKELCFEALRSNEDGLRSADVKAWIAKNHPGTKTASVPATLSRQLEQGALQRDGLGRYQMVR